MTSRMLKIMKAALILATCTAWLVFAVQCWKCGYGLYIPDCAWMNWLKEHFGSSLSMNIYLLLSGFPFIVFYLTVLLPDLSRRFFPLKGRKRLVFRILIIALVCFAACCAAAACMKTSTAPAALKWLFINAKAVGIMRLINIWLPPVSLLLILFAWTLPVAIRFFRNAHKEQSFKPVHVRRTFAFYGLLAAIAALVTAASAAMLAIVDVYAPNASMVVTRMMENDAKNLNGLFVCVVLAPVIEEIAFRGLIQHHTRRVLPGFIAILTAAVFFGLWHRNIGQFVYIFAWAVIFGIIYNAAGRVHHTILMHGLGNLFAAMAFSTSGSALLGKQTLLPAIRTWLMNLPLVPAVLMIILLAAALIAAVEAALYLVTGKENRFVRLVKRCRKGKAEQREAYQTAC